MNDFKFAFRQLVKSPGFTAAAVLTLGLAIGVNTAIFSLVYGTILKPVVAKDPDAVVAVFTSRKGLDGGYRPFTHDEYLGLRNAKEVFADACAESYTVAGVGVDPESQRRGFVFFVSDNYFSFHGAAITQGRGFTAEECKPGANIPVLMLSDDYWHRLGARPDIVGSTLRVNGEAFTVVGVTPRGFSGTHAMIAPQIWLPLGTTARVDSDFAAAAADLTNPRTYALNVMARLASGLTMANAQVKLPVLDERLNALAPPDTGGARELQIMVPSRLGLSTSPNTKTAGVRLIGVLFLGLAAVVLFIACLNLANMLLARGAARRKEIALRLALGAERGRVIRQLLVEGFVLAMLGGVVGLTLSYWANGILLSSLREIFDRMPFGFSIVLDLTPDLATLAVTFAICLAATLFFSLGPALNLTRVDLANDLKQQAGEFAHGPSHRLFAPRHVLAMAQIALSLALVFCAALFFRGGSLAALVDPGFTTKGGILSEVDYSLARVKGDDALPRFIRLRDRIAAVPGVASVALNTMVPYGNTQNNRRLVPAAEVVSTATRAGEARGSNGVLHLVTTGFFGNVGIPILEGRDFTPAESDQTGAPRVVILDEKAAKQLFPNGGAIGQRVKGVEAKPDGTRPEMEVIGVVRNIRFTVLDTEADPNIYVPFAQEPGTTAYFHVRLANESPAAVSAFLPVLRREFLTTETELPLLSVQSFADFTASNIELWIIRVGSALFAAFGGAALLIAAIGVYGVHAYAVSRRTREIGIRMSLGARPADIFQLIMSLGVKQTATALALGVVLALGAGQLIGSLLYRVSPYDPLALGGAIFVLGLAALLACYFPARRATRVNPITALRME